MRTVVNGVRNEERRNKDWNNTYISKRKDEEREISHSENKERVKEGGREEERRKQGGGGERGGEIEMGKRSVQMERWRREEEFTRMEIEKKRENKE
uniref:Uncharacterized protein n=1 Tax=Pristionchus pacificus TaxID=54126 RepID=A0A2A6CSQ5_PRIPA|eukprot:PDM81138.1 hypothetical protein PRIPAC_36141 [Pristionchus pacificus]